MVNPPVQMDAESTQLLSQADRSLGRLDGVATVLPNPNLFVAMYVRQEAVLSSQIEGTQSTLEDVLQFEVDRKGRHFPMDVEEVVNYVRAMNHGLDRLKELPLSLRLIRQIDAELLKGVRGAHRTPGEFRKSQNWIRPQNCTLKTATFVPPPVHEMHQALDNLEKFLHETTCLPVLIHCGLAHAQFETIHPFLDGNGRVGRLLTTFLLCQRGVLQRPLLYLSHFFKAHRPEYYDRLMAIRIEGDWEGWLKFFLRGVDEVGRGATETARAILDLREEHRQAITTKPGGSPNGLQLLDILPGQAQIGKMSPLGKKNPGNPKEPSCAQEAGISEATMRQRRSIMESTRAQVEAICAESISDAEKLEKIREVRRAAAEQMNALITPEQLQKLQECQKARAGRHMGAHPSGAAHPAHPAGPCTQSPQ